MKRALVVIGLVVAGVLVVDVLGDLTQVRGDPVVEGSHSEVVMELSGRRYKHDLDNGAENLVAACAGTTFMRVAEDSGVTKVGPGRYRFTVEPALGTYNQRKLVGCLQDLTVDHLLAEVMSVEHHGLD